MNEPNVAHACPICGNVHLPAAAPSPVTGEPADSDLLRAALEELTEKADRVWESLNATGDDDYRIADLGKAVLEARAALASGDRPREAGEAFHGQMTWPCVCGHMKAGHYFGDQLGADGRAHTWCQNEPGHCQDFRPAASPEPGLPAEPPEPDPDGNAMWAYQFAGSLTTVYDFADDDIVPLLDHLSAMAEGKRTGNENTAAVPGSVKRWADTGDAAKPAATASTGLEELRALSDAATPGPWRWLADSGEVMLWGEGDPGGEGHVLTPHVCPACLPGKRGLR